MISLFESNQGMFESEKSLVLFAIAWLQYDVLRQNAISIERILRSIRTNKKVLTADFIQATLTLDREILSIWIGYQKWLLETALLPRMSNARRDHVDTDFNKQVSRNYRSSDCLPHWMVHMTPEIEFKRFVPTLHVFKMVCSFHLCL